MHGPMNVKIGYIFSGTDSLNILNQFLGNLCRYYKSEILM